MNSVFINSQQKLVAENLDNSEKHTNEKTYHMCLHLTNFVCTCVYVYIILILIYFYQPECVF